MQSYTTIFGAIKLHLQKQSYGIVQTRLSIGSSIVTLIMMRFKERDLSFDDLKQMEPRKLETTLCHPEIPAGYEHPSPGF